MAVSLDGVLEEAAEIANRYLLASFWGGQLRYIEAASFVRSALAVYAWSWTCRNLWCATFKIPSIPWVINLRLASPVLTLLLWHTYGQNRNVILGLEQLGLGIWKWSKNPGAANLKKQPPTQEVMCRRRVLRTNNQGFGGWHCIYRIGTRICRTLVAERECVEKWKSSNPAYLQLFALLSMRSAKHVVAPRWI